MTRQARDDRDHGKERAKHLEQSSHRSKIATPGHHRNAPDPARGNVSERQRLRPVGSPCDMRYECCWRARPRW